MDRNGSVRAAPAALLVALTAWLVPFDGAGADVETTVGTRGEGWFRPSPACALPTGCGPTDAVSEVSPYPPRTLHVGVAAGREESRTYLALDTGTLPEGSRILGGTLVVPIDETDAGTLRPETAGVLVCATAAAFPNVEGSFAPPPPVDCSAGVRATPAAGRLVVDLTPFGAAAGGGLALLPDLADPTATWHLAFSGRDRGDADVPPVTAVLRVAVPDDEDVDGGDEEEEAGDEEEVAVLPPSGVGGGGTASEPFPAVDTELPGDSGTAVGPDTTAPVASVLPVVDDRYAYAVVWLLPLVLLFGGWVLVWTFTAPVTRL